MKSWITSFIVVLVLAGGSYVFVQHIHKSTPSPVTSDIATTVITKPPTIPELWRLTNVQRIKAHLQPLALDSRLDKSAQAKCDDMIGRNYWAHDTPDGKTPWTFILRYTTYRDAGENLAENFSTSEDTIAGWMGSPEHRANLLRPVYTNVGFGVCHSDNFMNEGPQYLVVQHLTLP